jgi:ABC-type sugar transport system substrate-binding protein
MRTLRSRRTKLAVAAGACAAFTLAARAAGYKLGLNTPVRCRDGHVFRTVWLPGVNLKALDLGIARVQRCPVGRHWSLVTPVRDRDLSPGDRQRAPHDVWLP